MKNEAKTLIEALPGKIEKALKGLLMPNEQVQHKIKGAFKEGLICTNQRVIILKSGYMTGQLFGTNTFQLPYRNIASVEVKFHLLTGYFELSSGGMQNTDKSYWSQSKGRSPAKAPNTISLNRRNVKKFQEACTFIMANIEGSSAPSQAAAANSSNSDIYASLEKLGQLKEKSLISEAEYNTKKTELLARI